MWGLNRPHGVLGIGPCGLSQGEGSWFDSRSERSSPPTPGPGPLLGGPKEGSTPSGQLVGLRGGGQPPQDFGLFPFLIRAGKSPLKGGQG